MLILIFNFTFYLLKKKTANCSSKISKKKQEKSKIICLAHAYFSVGESVFADFLSDEKLIVMLQ